MVVAVVVAVGIHVLCDCIVVAVAGTSAVGGCFFRDRFLAFFVLLLDPVLVSITVNCTPFTVNVPTGKSVA